MNGRRTGLAFIISGAVLILAALSLVLYNKYDDYRCSKNANDALTYIEDVIPFKTTLERIENEGYKNSPQIEAGGTLSPEINDTTNVEKMEPLKTFDINGTDYIGVIHIPSMKVTLPVTKNWSNKLMKKAACRYDGSALYGNLIICAHNLPSFFKGIQQLNTRDNIIFIDADNKEYVYEVIQIEILGAYDVDAVKAGSDEWDITLFSCTYGGKERVTVRAVQVNKQ